MARGGAQIVRCEKLSLVIGDEAPNMVIRCALPAPFEGVSVQ
jgi:hypothetical protein